MSNILQAALPKLTAEIYGGGTLSATMPRLSVLAAGTSHEPNGIDAILPILSGAAYGGATLNKPLPKITLSAAGTTKAVGRISATLPSLTISASGISGAVGRISKPLPSITGSANGGGYLTAILPMFEMSSAGNVGAVGHISVTLPALTMEAAASADAYWRLVATLPAMRAGAVGRINVQLPSFRMNAASNAADSVPGEGYAVNLKHENKAVTRYTNFPFTHIIKHAGNYYGVAADGLYLLAGDEDSGKDINSRFDTGYTDFGSKQLKRAVSAYINGEEVGDVSINDGNSHEYVYTAERRGQFNHRVKFGRGLRSRHFSIGVSSAKKVDSIDFEIDVLERAA